MHALDRTCLSPGLPHGITPYAGRRVVSCLLRQRRRRSIDRFINMARHITPRSNPPVVRSKEGGGNGNGSDSRPGDGEAILTAVKRNGAGSIKGPIPGISDGSGSGSGSGNGNGHGGSGNNGGSGSNNEGNSNRYNGVLFMAGVLAAAAGLYAGYQIVSALRNKNRDQLAAATSQPERYITSRCQHLQPLQPAPDCKPSIDGSLHGLIGLFCHLVRGSICCNCCS